MFFFICLLIIKIAVSDTKIISCSIQSNTNGWTIGGSSASNYEWITDENTCPNIFNQITTGCAKFDRNIFMESTINGSILSNISITYDIKLGDSAYDSNDEFFEVGYNCDNMSTDYTYVNRKGQAESQIYFTECLNETFILPNICNYNPNIMIKFIQQGSKEFMYLNNVCININFNNNTIFPTQIPTILPTINPTTNNPTFIPTTNPVITNEPTLIPTTNPTIIPTYIPTNMSINITNITKYPTFIPTNIPTFIPTNNNTINNTNVITQQPTLIPTKLPIINHTNTITEQSTLIPTNIPTIISTLITSHNKPTTNIQLKTIENLLKIIIILGIGVFLLMIILCIAMIWLMKRKKKLLIPNNVSDTSIELHIRQTNTNGNLFSKSNDNLTKGVSIENINNGIITPHNEGLGEHIYKQSTEELYNSSTPVITKDSYGNTKNEDGISDV